MNWVLIILGLVAVGGAGYLLYSFYRNQTESLDEERRKKVECAQPVGWYLTPFHTSIILRPILSITAGGILAMSLYVFGQVIGSTLLPSWAALVLWLLSALLFGLNDKDPINVPTVYVAILTFLGMRLNIYLSEGYHPWYAGRFGFGRSTDPLPNRDGYEKEEEEGFVFIGDRPVTIWPSREDKGKVMHMIVTGDGSSVMASLTDTFKVFWPLQWANSHDPILDIAERSRSGLRTIASFIPGFDNVKMKTIFTGLMGGETLVVGMTTKQVDIFGRGSVVQDGSGRQIFEMVPYKPNESSEDRKARVAKARKRVADRVLAEGDPTMLEVALGKDKKPLIQDFHLDQHLVPVLTDCGAHLERATVSTLNFSNEVQEQANRAAGESFQRRGQRMNAETMRESSKTMRDELKKEGGEAALAAALAADGKASYIHVSGGDRLSRAAVAGAKSIGDKK